MIFNPFSLNEKENALLNENDPDIHFYNDIGKLFMDNSPYLFEDNFNTSVSKLNGQSNFGILHANIRSLSAHKLELEALLTTINFQFPVIGLTETW